MNPYRIEGPATTSFSGGRARVAALFVRRDSICKKIDGVECFDIDRDARNFLGGIPVVAHPPCRAWGQLRHMAKPRADEKELAIFAVDIVRRCGGVLEHPERSSLWPVAGLPDGEEVDCFGGFSLVVDQYWWGHRARKRTKFYIVGCDRSEVTNIPLVLGGAEYVVGSSSSGKPEITKREREETPVGLALWLVDLAARCRK
ncbi:MAG: hypothetical protein L6Q55_00960 [Azonexus sp.]|nr:hypothetical protein [Azonexus sp.]MCK6410978.1 hypothetical protein [Azonexus sp.]